MQASSLEVPRETSVSNDRAVKSCVERTTSDVRADAKERVERTAIVC